MPRPPEPIIIEPDNPNPRQPKPGSYLLYDHQFPVETSPTYAVTPPAEPLRIPHFSLGEVARIAFADRVEWLRHQIKGKPWVNAAKQKRTTPLTLQGKPLTFRTTARGDSHAPRRFTLPDIERLAWALYERSDLDGYELQRISTILAAIADQYFAHVDKRSQ